MAKMIPPYISSNVKSEAERLIYKVIKEELDLSWTCLHSLGLSEHQTKTESEIDFLLLGPKGIFVLEVKGGIVKRQSGVWQYVNRYSGKVHKKIEGPFEQAKSATYSLMRRAKKKHPFASSVLFGYGVVFPDIKFNIDSPEWDERIIYDADDLSYLFSKYVERLFNYWKSKLPHTIDLTRTQCIQLANWLRGDFELVKKLPQKISEAEQKIISLTENQYKALDRLENNKRIIFKGAAGTGKTLLAVEQARRLSAYNKRVLFICFNRLLASYLKKLFEDESVDNVNVFSLYGLYYRVIVESGWKEYFLEEIKKSPEKDIYKNLYPAFVNKAVQSIDIPLYNYLIIDEGQDVLNIELLSPLDFFLEGGLEYGSWAVFLDPNKQSTLFHNYEHSFEQFLLESGAVEYKLDINCRNTRPIAVQTAALTGGKIESSLIEGGEPVQYIYFSSEKILIKKISDCITRLFSEGISPEDIILLCSKKEYVSLIENNLKDSFNLLKIDVEWMNEKDKLSIKYTTVQSFKGLESKVLIYISALDFEDEWCTSVNYVAMSRARSLLIIFMNESLKDKALEKATNFALKGAD